MSKRPGRVLYASDDRGFAQLAVAVHSLLSTADPARPLEVMVYTGCGALSGEHRSRLGAMVARFSFASLSIYDVDSRLEAHRDALSRSNTHWGTMIWARCLVGEVPGNVDGPVVYLDIDTLVCRDLGELYDMDMSDAGDGRSLVLAAVGEECRETGERHDPIWTNPLFDRRATRYFNSGFLVMNATAFREEGLFGKLVAWYARHKHEVVRPDQDALNCLFWDRTRFMHPRYNHCDGWLERQARCRLSAANWRGNPPVEVLEAITAPAVLHFWGSRKPWRANHRPEAKRYEREMREAGVLDGALPGTSVFTRIRSSFFGLYHAILRRQVARRLKLLREGK